MVDIRDNREADKRVKRERPKHWMPPELLPYPDPEPGFDFKYVRTSIMGEPDAKNISSNLREGWVPVKAADYPELMVHEVQSGRYAGCIEFGGLLLCKIPKEFMEQRRKYYEDLTKSQMEAIDNNMFQEEDARMPMFKERSSKTRFGSGT